MSDIRSTIEQKVFDYVNKNKMIAPGDTIILGVSGGADSVCLFFLLLQLREQTDFELRVVHINHGIRPDAAEDEAFVERLCGQHSVPFRAVRADVPALAKQEKCSEEDAGRRLRYRVFREEEEGFSQGKIAVAHHADDRAETMLLHLFRGTSTRGLCGMEPVRGDIIRPLLVLERGEIEAYLRELSADWCTDSTNGTDEYTRNRIRHHILPYAKEQICGSVVANMNRTAELICETEEYLRMQTAQAKKLCVQDNRIEVAPFHTLPRILQKRLILELAEQFSPTGKDISLVHVEDVLTLFEKDQNRTICLPFGITFRRQYDRVVIDDGRLQSTAQALPEFVMTPIFPKDTCEIVQKQYTKWFDYDKIVEPLEIRTRRAGDYLTVSDGKGGMIHKSLKDYMITEKIPREERDSIPVLAQGSHIVWLVGYRISEYFKVERNTTHILQVECKKDFPVGSRTEEKDEASC